MSAVSLARRALAVFDEALDQPEAIRSVWLQAQCAGDIELEAETRMLLNAAVSDGGILDIAPAGPLLGGGSGAIASALGDRYEILREIGRGGMATVYLAHERKHDRDVVVKVLNPMVARLCGRERFEREVHIAAMLAHPHIAPLIDSGEADGFLYYVMPWMDGRSLRDLLNDEPPSQSDALRILRDIASALEFAHAAGVIHRDLKPENVLMASGHAYLLDFGIAKLGKGEEKGEAITAAGFALGTRRYMAPEQVHAAAAVDARADVYAWGALAAETLLGRPLPTGDAQQMARRELERVSAIPTHVIELVVSCLAIAPAERPASMSAVLARLAGRRPRGLPHRWATPAKIAVFVAVASGGAALIAARRPAAEGSMLQPLAATVLRNETGDSSLSVIGRFAGDWVTDGLQRLGLVTVVPWSAALLASERATSAGTALVTTMRDETKAGTVLTGSYYRLHDSLYLQAQLTDARSGTVVTNLAPIVVPMSRPEDAIAQLRDRVMGAVALAGDDRVSHSVGVARVPPSFTAYQVFDVGLDHFLAQEYDAALASYREAYRLDSTFTTALQMGARAAWNSGARETADSLVRLARANGPQLGSYQEATLRFLEAVMQGDGSAARIAIQRASALAPNTTAGYEYASALLSAGQAAAALAQLKRMDPDRGEMRRWSSYWTARANAAYSLNLHDEALRAAHELARRFPERRVAQVLEARALAASGKVGALDSALVAWEPLKSEVYWSQGAAMAVAAEELLRRGNEVAGRRYAMRAIAWLNARLAAAPTDRPHRYWLGSVLYSLERYEEARVVFEALATEFPDRLAYRRMAAVTNARRGDRGAAVRWLGVPRPYDIGEHKVYEARIAAIYGDKEQAIALLTSALHHGAEGFSWVAGSAFRDFGPLLKDTRMANLFSGR